MNCVDLFVYNEVLFIQESKTDKMIQYKTNGWRSKMDVFGLRTPGSIYGGAGCLKKINEVIEKESAHKILVFTDKGIERSGLSKMLTDILDVLSIDYRVIDSLMAEPSYKDVERALESIGAEDFDLIIAIGGGSVMDAAKLGSVLINASYKITDLLLDPQVARKSIKSVMIPTTCGTGSEATPNAIVLVPEKDVKIGIVNAEMIPDYVFLDPEMIKNLPSHILAGTAVDALAHAVECYTSKKATAFSDLYALASAKMIFQNIREAYVDPTNLVAKSNLLIAAYYGGVAITGSGTTAVHALSYPLGGKYHIPHGVSNAILLPHVMEFNKPSCSGRLAEICDAINPGFEAKSKDEKAEHIIEELLDVVKVTQIPTNLKEFGVEMDQLENLVGSASQVTRLLVNNPREMKKDDIRNIYLKIMKE